jgi:hypothetical protein
MIAVLAALAMPGVAMAQSNPITGRAASQVHGQNWNMGQDLHSSPGPAATASRTERLRQTSRQATGQHRAQARAARPAQSSATGSHAGLRAGSSQASFEQRLAEERRRQMRAEERAARAFPGVI